MHNEVSFQVERLTIVGDGLPILDDCRAVIEGRGQQIAEHRATSSKAQTAPLVLRDEVRSGQRFNGPLEGCFEKTPSNSDLADLWREHGGQQKHGRRVSELVGVK